MNGIRNINSNIHDTTNIDTFENHKCQMILTRGKNKGNFCSKNCALGYDYCKIHQKKYIKEQVVNNNVINK